MTDEEIREALEAEGYSPEYIEAAVYLNNHPPEITDKLYEIVEAGIRAIQAVIDAMGGYSGRWASLFEAVKDIPTPTDAERLNLAVPWRKERRHTPKYIRPTKRQVQRRPARVARSSCQRHHG